MSNNQSLSLLQRAEALKLLGLVTNWDKLTDNRRQDFIDAARDSVELMMGDGRWVDAILDAIRYVSERTD